MKTHSHTDPERLHVLAARLKVWLLNVCVWLSEWLGHRLPRPWRIEMRANIRHVLRSARAIVLLHALSRCGEAPALACPRHPHAPRGYRLSGVFDNDLRNICRTVRLRGRTLAQRLGEVRDLFDALNVWIARVRRRLMVAPQAARLVLCFVVGDRLCGLTTQIPNFADSS